MKGYFICCLCLAFGLGYNAATAQGLNIGDHAPDFSLTASDGKTYTLSQFKGRQAVVIAFFPKAFTGG